MCFNGTARENQHEYSADKNEHAIKHAHETIHAFIATGAELVIAEDTIIIQREEYDALKTLAKKGLE